MNNSIINKIAARPGFYQFGKFFLVGITNTGIDFAVYNFLMWITQISEGFYVNVFTTVSFLVAVVNSYLLNKYWTFKEKDKSKDQKQFIKFFFVSFIGLILNNAIIYYLVNIVHPAFGLSPVLWANFAKAIATCAVLFWNFCGFKFLVFKK